MSRSAGSIPARIEMRNLLRRLGEMGKTIIVSSHILPELADICNKIGIIDRGVMTVNANVADVLRQVRERVVLHVEVADNLEDAARLLQANELVDYVQLDHHRITVTLRQGVEDYSDLSSLLIHAGYKLKLFSEKEVNLESAFMALTKGMGAKTIGALWSRFSGAWLV